MQSLTLATAQSHILSLPNRPPFMLASALAEFYEVEPKRIGEAVKRNPARFPADFVFEPTDLEAAAIRAKWSQNAATSQGSRSDLRPLAFTEAGALALSGVLKSARAAEISVIIVRAFIALRDAAREAIRRTAAHHVLRAERADRALSYVHHAVLMGLDFASIEAMRPVSWPRKRVLAAAHELFVSGTIADLPEGTPPLPTAVPSANASQSAQFEMFAEG